MDSQGKAISGMAGITFSIYKDQFDGPALWLETQNVQADSRGAYVVQLGSTKSEGLPADLFNSGEARWLGVQINGQPEQARVLLLSVPYALKASDAETLGGLPPSAFVLAAPSLSPVAAPAASASPALAPPLATVTGTGTTNFVPLWTGTTTIGNSALFQTGSGNSSRVGINTTSPAATLDVKGAETVRGNLSLPALNPATAAAGNNSEPLSQSASAFNSSTSTSVSQNFRWQAEPAANNTASPSGTMNLLFGSGGNPISETGLKIGSNGTITFAPGQTFPGGSVTSVGLSAPSSDFTVSGSPVTSSGTLTFAWNVAPTSTNTANAIVKRDASGSFSGTSIAGQTTASYSGSGVSGLASATGPGTSFGVSGTSYADSGSGVFGYASGSTGIGVTGMSLGASGYGVAGYNFAGTGVGVYASGNGWGFYTDSNVHQGVNAGGWVKGMVVADSDSGIGVGITRCFNSTLPAGPATTPPCGFIAYGGNGGPVTIDFGFDVSQRFVSVTMIEPAPTSATACVSADCGLDSNNYVEVDMYNIQDQKFGNGRFYLVVY
jgi:hypothetical protein